jgi:hypothetical protein
MPQINISDGVYARVVAFKPLVESLLEVSLETDSYVELLLRMAPDFVMGEAFGSADAKALFSLILQLVQSHPEVYGALADILDRDEKTIELQQRAQVKRALGFPEPQA